MRLEVSVAKRLGAFALEAAFASDGGVTALFGRSGSGKTSVLNAIAGLLRPERGRIALDGEPMFDAAASVNVAAHRRRIGYVFQEGRLLPHLTVRQNLLFGRRFARGSGAVALDKVTELLGLAALLERRPHDLSGGEKQRVAIGRALLADPRLLLMDEPLAALDAPRKAEILGYIELLRDEFRLPMVYVSHAIEEVTRLADRLVLVSEGRTIAEGEVAELLSRADLKPHTGRFEAGAVIDARVARLDERYGLTVLAFAGGELVVANLDALPGEPVRARIRSRDVALALEKPRASSFQNVLEARVESIGGEFGAIVDVHLRVGATPLVARITRESAQRLALAPGVKAFALVKAIAIDRRSVGYA